MGGAVFPPCCLSWGQTLVEVMKIMVTSFKRSHAALTLQQATNPYLHQKLLDTHRQVWLSLLWDHCSFLLGPGAHKVLFVPSKNLFPQSCVSSGSSTVGLMVTSSKRAYAIPRSAAPRAPAPVAGHCWPVPLQEMLRHSSGSVSVGPLVSGVHRVWLSPPSISGRHGVWFQMWFHPSSHFSGASPLLLDMRYIFWWDPTFSCQRLFSSEL